MDLLGIPILCLQLASLAELPLLGVEGHGDNAVAGSLGLAQLEPKSKKDGSNTKVMARSSVADPYHFDTDPDP